MNTYILQRESTDVVSGQQTAFLGIIGTKNNVHVDIGSLLQVVRRVFPDAGNPRDRSVYAGTQPEGQDRSSHRT